MDAEPASVVTPILDSIQQEELPQLRADFPGINWTFVGSQAEMRESTEALWGSFLPAMIVIGAIPFRDRGRRNRTYHSGI